MTDQKPDSDNAAILDQPTSAETPPAALVAPAPAPKAAPPAPKSGRGVAWLALLVGLGAGGGSGYLWYLWQQDQAAQAGRLDAAIKQAIARQDPELQAIKAQVQQFQALKAGIDQARTDAQALREQFLGLTGDLQPLKNAMELHKGENEVIKGEMNLLREGQDAHKTHTQQQQTGLNQQLQQQQAALAALQEQLQNMKLAQAGLTAELETVKTIAAKGGDVNAFPLAEIDYLLRLAETKLEVERNIDAARLALDAAQQRLRTVRETGLTRVQTMLGEAIASLRGVQLPDIAALAQKLLAMEKRVGSLPLRLDSSLPDIRDRIKPATTLNLSPDTERSWWDRSFEAVLNQFKDIVVIRRQQRIEAPPLIPRENEFFLRQNLVMEMDGMRLALLRGDAETYQAAYQTVYDWTQTYYDAANPKVAQFLAELQALQAIQFNPYIPDLSGLRQAFQEFMALRQPLRALRPTQVTPVPAAAPVAEAVAPAESAPATESSEATTGEAPQ